MLYSPCRAPAGSSMPPPGPVWHLLGPGGQTAPSASDTTGRNRDEPPDLPGGSRRRPDPGRLRDVPRVEPGAQRADSRPGRRELGPRPERGLARIALPGVHRRAARGHRPRAPGLLLAGLGPDHRRLLLLDPGP